MYIYLFKTSHNGTLSSVGEKCLILFRQNSSTARHFSFKRGSIRLRYISHAPPAWHSWQVLAQNAQQHRESSSPSRFRFLNQQKPQKQPEIEINRLIHQPQHKHLGYESQKSMNG
jgi:hypothetical protein